ncbi:MAG: ferredoxin reductase family protein [Candidatus Saccharimonadales bacterium]
MREDIRNRLRRSLGWSVSLSVALIIPLYLWLRLPELIGEVSTLRHGLTVVAKVGAFTGFASFMWSLVLGARLKSIDKLFLGLDKAYKAHRIFGSYSFIAIAVHAVAITAAIAMSAPLGALRMWVPGVDAVVTWGVIAFLGMAALLTATVLYKLPYQTFLTVHRLLGLLLVPAALHTFLASGHLLDNPALRRYMLIVTFIGALSYLYHSVLGEWLTKKYPYRVEAVNHLGEDITEIILQPSWHPVSFRPGQFGYLSMRDAAVQREAHPFSFSSSRHDRQLGFVVKNLGDYTAKIGEVHPGVRAIVDGPYGNFSYLNSTSRRQIWIAGGIGITPFLSMVRSFPDKLRYDIDFFYCTKSDTDALFHTELTAVAKRHAGFRMHHICEEREGFMNLELLQQRADIQAAAIFICGPPPMLNGLRKQFVAAGIDEDRLHYEEFSF